MECVTTTTTVPLLPCLAVDDSVEFYEALGFDVARRQTRPYLYMAFQLGNIELHFKDAAPHLDPSDELSGGCLVMVDAVEGYHLNFTSGLRRRYGRRARTGLAEADPAAAGPDAVLRIRPVGELRRLHRPRRTRHRIRRLQSLSGLAKALDNVGILRDFKNDDALAARALDVALRRHGDSAPRVDLARAMANRVELAIALGDSDGATTGRGDLAAMALNDAERAAMDVDLRAIDEVERWLSH